MNLVAYSDSEDSGSEAPATKPAPKPTAKATLNSKPAFQKIIDRANPSKIRINLPAPSKGPEAKDDIDSDAPPAKKARLDGGPFGGFNSILPAPKKAVAVQTPSPSTSALASKGIFSRGLGPGGSLRTGATAAFSREAVEMPDYNAEEEEDHSTAEPGAVAPETKSKEPEVKLVGKNTMFRPLSVANKNKKKRVLPAGITSAMLKKAPVAGGSTSPSAAPRPTSTKPAAPPTLAAPKPKVSLFSMAPAETPDAPDESITKDYTPLLHVPSRSPSPDELPDDAFWGTTTAAAPSAAPTHATNQSLSTTVNDLNLSPHELRQLLGRNGDASALNVRTFDTDAEYRHNELLRQQGETVQHHAVRSIAGTGKNSLKSLVNVATTQKEALEEHFATSRRNQKEGASKYGW